jgi:hypothetical protein
METSTLEPTQRQAADEQRVVIRSRRIVRPLWIIMALVVLAGLAGQVVRVTTGHEWLFGLIPKTNLYNEGNIPAFFSAMLLAFAALLLTVIAVSHRSRGERFGRHWVALAVVFFGLSMDEAVAFHELATEPLRAILNTGGIFFYAWIIPGLGFLALFAVSFWRFFWNLPTDTKRRFALAGAMFVFGAVGVELVESAVADHHGEAGMDYVLLVGFEEALEMAGVIVFIDALFRYIVGNVPRVNLRFTRK